MNFERVDFKNNVTKNLSDHEIFMSFFDDIGAEAFKEWWEHEGAQFFRAYCEEDHRFRKAL